MRHLMAKKLTYVMRGHLSETKREGDSPNEEPQSVKYRSAIEDLVRIAYSP